MNGQEPNISTKQAFDLCPSTLKLQGIGWGVTGNNSRLVSFLGTL
jgi:hypothetical protein